MVWRLFPIAGKQMALGDRHTVAEGPQASVLGRLWESGMGAKNFPAEQELGNLGRSRLSKASPQGCDHTLLHQHPHLVTLMSPQAEHTQGWEQLEGSG